VVIFASWRAWAADEGETTMPLLRKKHRNPGQPAWFDRELPPAKVVPNGYRFSLKGSPRHYDDVKKIIEADPGARLYFSEALTNERGAGVALWRIEANSFAWLKPLYAWWAEMERVEPIRFTFFLYFPEQPKHAAMDLRQFTPAEVEQYIKEHAPRSEAAAQRAARRF
jgi:hypothetical protein